MPRPRSRNRYALPAALLLAAAGWCRAFAASPGPAPAHAPAPEPAHAEPAAPHRSGPGPAPGDRDGSRVEFNRDIRPILSDHCFACHGFDPKKRKAGLRLDVAEGALGSGTSGKPAVQPGDPEASELWRRLVTPDADEVMPPPDVHKPLQPGQKALLRRWIEEGAPYQKPWAFEAPVRVEPPVLQAGLARTPSNPVDRFLLSRLEREGLAPSPEASREELIRRLRFDLTGLPPRPEEVDAFVGDTAPGAYERLVDRLLGAPEFGEEMARHWLDVARYADTHGMHLDNERQMWAYRDWVVRAFNRNLPYDQFTLDQLAGDLLPNPTQDQQVATGFNRNNVTTGEGGSIDAELIFRYAVDRTATTVQAWMGLTAGCAVCHDHKFDPLSSKEFYSLYALFHSAADPAMDGNALLTPPVLRLTTPEDERRLAGFDQRLAAVEARLPAALAGVRYLDPAEAQPRPPARELEGVWVDDEFPPGAKTDTSTGGASRFVTAAEGPVHSGRLALRRRDAGLVQDVIETASSPLEIPSGARLFAHVHLDPRDPPRSIMLQYRTSEWKHRVVWGDPEAIDWGARNTPERAFQGPLPAAGTWVRLEFDAAVVGLKPGDRITGFALTQFGGTVSWDRVGVAGRLDPATDPRQSFQAWLRQFEGPEGEAAAKALPEDLRKIARPPQSETRSEDSLRRLRDHYLARVCLETRPVFDPILSDLARLRKQREEYEGAIPSTFVWRDLEKPRESHVMIRGAYDQPGEKVTPGVPAALPPLATASNLPPNRLDFARWLVSDAHPLTARVAVNRFWQQFFGVGLVKTSGDFGSQGEPPSHPELLDWLAVTFRETGWDTKALVRLLVTSHAYRQSSRVRPGLLERDPENRLLARASRLRLDAEQIRDNALFVSGLLVPEMGGKGVKPYQPPNLWEPVGFVGSNTREYRQDHGAALYRRSLYTFFKRTAPPPFMAAFDAPNREQSCTRRERSNTPLQALQLLNDVQHFEAARGLAERMLREGGPTPEDRLTFAFRTVLARTPDAGELVVLRRALSAHLARYADDPDAARAVVEAGESKPHPALPRSELAAYTLAANLVLNLDETLTRN